MDGFFAGLDVSTQSTKLVVIDAGAGTVIHVDVDQNMHLFAPGLQEFKAMHQEPGA